MAIRLIGTRFDTRFIRIGPFFYKIGRLDDAARVQPRIFWPV